MELRNTYLRLRWSEDGLSLHSLREGKTIFSGAGIGLSLLGQPSRDLRDGGSVRVESDDSLLRLTGRIGTIELRLDCRLSEEVPELMCSLVIQNLGDRAVRLGEVYPLVFDRKRGAETHLLTEVVDVFSLGNMMVDSAQLGTRLPGNKRTFALTLDADEPHYLAGYMLAARPVRSGSLTSECTCSFDRIAGIDCGFSIDLESGTASARASYGGADLPPDESLDLPTLYLDGISSAASALDRAADRVAALYSPPVPKEAHAGWCSWYYYYPHVSEEDILANTRFLAENRDRLSCDVIQIDDGYQKHWGDWLEPGEKFPHDMAWLAERIREQGFKAGIWVAPMIMTVQSRLYAEHPDWAVRNFETGEPLSQKGWSPPEENPWVILDGTHPEFLEYIRKVFSTMAHEWGYDYFKLDALSHGGYAGLRHDPTCTGDAAIRRVVEVVREAIGPDKYLLGCTVPFGSAVGLVNGERVSGDVSTAFRAEDNGCCLENYLPQSIHRSFIHGKWWHNDPDCVLVRSQGTPHNEALSKKGLSLTEARFFVSVVGLLQGIRMIGENLTVLEEERLALLEMLEPPLPAPARAIDFFARRPERLSAAVPGGLLVAMLNWGRSSSDRSFRPSEWSLPGDGSAWTVFDLWETEVWRQERDTAKSLSVPAQGVRLLLLRPAEPRPQFAGFDGHLSGGGSLPLRERWNADEGSLELEFEANRAGKVYLSCPDAWTAPPSLEEGASVKTGLNRLHFRFERCVGTDA